MSRIEGLSRKQLITTSDLNEIRSNIQNQFPDLPPQARARLFANQVNRRIDDALYGVDMSSRRTIRHEIVRDHIMVGNDVDYLDLLDAITNQPMVGQKHLQDWLKLSVGLSVSQYELDLMANEAFRRKRKRQSASRLKDEEPTQFDIEMAAIRTRQLDLKDVQDTSTISQDSSTPTMEAYEESIPLDNEIVQAESVVLSEASEPIDSSETIDPMTDFTATSFRFMKRKLRELQDLENQKEELPWIIDQTENVESEPHDVDSQSIQRALQKVSATVVEPLGTKSAEAIERTKTIYRLNKKKLSIYIMIPLTLTAIIAIFGLKHDDLLEKRSLSVSSQIIHISREDKNQALTAIVEKVYNADKGGFPDYLRYSEVDLQSLRVYLKNRNSMLAEDPYFHTIVNACKAHDISPLLLFAITGQEQAFVPRDSKYLWNIINNPFNVYTSWKNYNTTLHDSTEVAAVTIKEMLRKRPKGHDPFKWLNDRYAEDPQWWRGTKIIFQQLTKATVK